MASGWDKWLISGGYHIGQHSFIERIPKNNGTLGLKGALDFGTLGLKGALDFHCGICVMALPHIHILSCAEFSSLIVYSCHPQSFLPSASLSCITQHQTTSSFRIYVN